MPQGLLLLPLLGGFLFLHLSHLFRFQAQRYDGNRLLFTSAAAGSVLLLIGRAAVLATGRIPQFGPWAGTLWYQLAPFPHSDTCAWSLVLGPLLAVGVVNRIWRPEAARLREIQVNQRADGLIRLIDLAVRRNELISVTLDNRKWYVGYTSEAPNLNPEEKYFRILPVLSGYRDSLTMEAHPTLFYSDVLEESDPADLLVTLPLASVKSANLFDPDLYDRYFSPPSPAPQPEQKPQASRPADEAVPGDGEPQRPVEALGDAHAWTAHCLEAGQPCIADGQRTAG